jgi:hypothetical protein
MSRRLYTSAVFPGRAASDATLFVSPTIRNPLPLMWSDTCRNPPEPVCAKAGLFGQPLFCCLVCCSRIVGSRFIDNSHQRPHFGPEHFSKAQRAMVLVVVVAAFAQLAIFNLHEFVGSLKADSINREAKIGGLEHSQNSLAADFHRRLVSPLTSLETLCKKTETIELALPSNPFEGIVHP